MTTKEQNLREDRHAQAIRDAALEEAAMLCDEQADRARTSPGSARATSCAERIRSLISSPPTASQPSAQEVVPAPKSSEYSRGIKDAADHADELDPDSGIGDCIRRAFAAREQEAPSVPVTITSQQIQDVARRYCTFVEGEPKGRYQLDQFDCWEDVEAFAREVYALSRAQPGEQVAQAGASETEVTRLRQGLWDVYAILGCDTDGDPTPAALVDDIVELVVSAAMEARADYDEAIAASPSAVQAEPTIGKVLQWLDESIAKLPSSISTTTITATPVQLAYVAGKIAECRAAPPKQEAAAPVVSGSGWQPIETAPEIKGDCFFCFLAWGPDGDKSTAKGLRWQGKWFAAPVFYRMGSERRFGFREIEVHPTHWMPLPAAPSPDGASK